MTGTLSRPFRIRARWLVASALYVGLIFFLSSRPYLRVPGPEFALKDKLAHGAEYGILAWLISRSLRPVKSLPVAMEVLWFVALGAGIAALDELFQGTVAGRVKDIFDWTADVVGLTLGSTLSLVHARRKRASS
jgi:VanZ family protein